jgi:AcrR family transcriptional regulator
MHTPAEPPAGSRPAMSTDRIMAAAVQIVDTEGCHALTMRRLGQALDRKVMTLYRYVPSKDALLDGVVGRVLTDLAVNPAAANWRQELRDLATSFRGPPHSPNPHAVPLLVTRPLGQQPPVTLRPLEDFLELLIRAGFTPRQRTARLPAVLRIPARTRPRRTAGTHRQPRRDRRPAPARPAPPPATTSPSYAPWPPNSPATTEPPTSSKASN